MTDQWGRQKKELDSYNVFYSAVRGDGQGVGFIDLGFRQVGNFLRVPDNRNNAESYPDIVLYNNETLLLVEVKSGNSVEPRDKNQMEEAGNLSIEAGRDFLSRADLRDPLLEPSDLTDMQPVIVYYKDTILSCQDSTECTNRLSQMANHGCVLSQEIGGQLEFVSGSVESSSLESTLRQGIPLRTSFETTVYLTEGVEREILSYSICHDMIRSGFATRDEMTITWDDVQSHYDGRSIGRNHTIDALEFLSIVGICSRNFDDSYTFKESNISKIMEVTEKLEEKRVVEWLEQDTSRQSSIDQFYR